MRVTLTRRNSVLRWQPICLLHFALLLWSACASASTNPAEKSVLMISDVGLAHAASAVITQEVMSELASDNDYQVEFYVESLDSNRSADEAPQAEVESRLVRKYQNYKLDAILAAGPAAIKMLSRVSGTFQPGVPIVICGAAEAQTDHTELTSRFTGTWFKLEPAKTVALALRLIPKTQHVVVVGGTSEFDNGVLAVTRMSLLTYSSVLDIRYLTDLDMGRLLDRLRHLPRGTIILYTSIFRDAAGNQFVNATTALPLVSDAANVPVFGISDTYIGRGIVGGYVVSFAEQGKLASRILFDLFRGRSPQEIPITTSPGVYIFDWRQLQRWNLEEARLPGGSVLINGESTLWQRAKWVFLSGLLVIIGLGSLTIFLLYAHKQLTRARREQIRLSGMLINAHEEERGRLAAELHDDFSQRLAMLSLGLETAAELVQASPEDARKQLDELLNSASELGADLHTLSHRLHSHTLERLGLVAGVSAFCKEFGVQHGIRVDFTSASVPRSVPPDISLCLFRIVQEGLRNVVKHGGASQAQVSLSLTKEGLRLSVSDNGVGFDCKDVATPQGLGLFSMEERARSIGARFELRSEPQRGTRIEVLVQLPRLRMIPTADASEVAVNQA